MRDSIYTIPITEVFEPRSGCPICRLRDTLEQRCVTYIMGAAMMEPDIRIETNKLGFCASHFEMMLHQKNRLSLALMLESHLKHLRETHYKEITAYASAKPRKRAGMTTVNDTCFVCDQITRVMDTMLSTVVDQWEKDPEFQALFAGQPCVCLPHAQLLLQAGQDHLPKKSRPAFEKQVLALLDQAILAVQEDVSHFCRMFDYRNASANADWGNSRDSIERAILLLATRDFREQS